MTSEINTAKRFLHFLFDFAEVILDDIKVYDSRHSDENYLDYIDRLHAQGWTKEKNSSSQVIAIKKEDASDEQVDKLIKSLKEAHVPFYTQDGVIVVPQTRYEDLQQIVRNNGFRTNTYFPEENLDLKTLDEAWEYYREHKDEFAEKYKDDDYRGIINSDDKTILKANVQFVKYDKNGLEISGDTVRSYNEQTADAEKVYVIRNDIDGLTDSDIAKKTKKFENFAEELKGRDIKFSVIDYGSGNKAIYIPHRYRESVDIYAMTHGYNIDFDEHRRVSFVKENDVVKFSLFEVDKINSSGERDIIAGTDDYVYKLESEFANLGFKTELSSDQRHLTIDLSNPVNKEAFEKVVMSNNDIKEYTMPMDLSALSIRKELEQGINNTVKNEVVRSGAAQFEFCDKSDLNLMDKFNKEYSTLEADFQKLTSEMKARHTETDILEPLKDEFELFRQDIQSVKDTAEQTLKNHPVEEKENYLRVHIDELHDLYHKEKKELESYEKDYEKELEKIKEEELEKEAELDEEELEQDDLERTPSSEQIEELDEELEEEVEENSSNKQNTEEAPIVIDGTVNDYVNTSTNDYVDSYADSKVDSYVDGRVDSYVNDSVNYDALNAEYDRIAMRNSISADNTDWARQQREQEEIEYAKHFEEMYKQNAIAHGTIYGEGRDAIKMNVIMTGSTIPEGYNSMERDNGRTVADYMKNPDRYKSEPVLYQGLGTSANLEYYKQCYTYESKVRRTEPDYDVYDHIHISSSSTSDVSSSNGYGYQTGYLLEHSDVEESKESNDSSRSNFDEASSTIDMNAVSAQSGYSEKAMGAYGADPVAPNPTINFRFHTDNDTYISRKDYAEKFENHMGLFSSFWSVTKAAASETDAMQGYQTMKAVTPIDETTYVLKKTIERAVEVQANAIHRTVSSLQSVTLLDNAVEDYKNTIAKIGGKDLFNTKTDEKLTDFGKYEGAELSKQAKLLQDQALDYVKTLNKAASQIGFEEWHGFAKLEDVVKAGKLDALLKDNRALEKIAKKMGLSAKEVKNILESFGKAQEKLLAIKKGVGDFNHSKVLKDGFKRGLKDKMRRIITKAFQGTDAFDFANEVYDVGRKVHTAVKVGKNSAKVIKKTGRLLQKSINKRIELAKKLAQKAQKAARKAEQIRRRFESQRRRATRRARNVRKARRAKQRVQAGRNAKNFLTRALNKTGLFHFGTAGAGATGAGGVAGAGGAAAAGGATAGGAAAAGGATAGGGIIAALGVVIGYLFLIILLIVAVVALLFGIFSIFSAVQNYDGTVENPYTDTAMGYEFNELREYEKKYYQLPYYIESKYATLQEIASWVPFLDGAIKDAINTNYIYGYDTDVYIATTGTTAGDIYYAADRRYIDDGRGLYEVNGTVSFGTDTYYLPMAYYGDMYETNNMLNMMSYNTQFLKMPISMCEIDCRLTETSFVNGDGVELGRVSNIKAILAMSGVVFSDEIITDGEVDDFYADVAVNGQPQNKTLLDHINEIDTFIGNGIQNLAHLLIDLAEDAGIGFNFPDVYFDWDNTSAQRVYGFAVYSASHSVFMDYDRSRFGYINIKDSTFNTSGGSTYHCVCRKAVVTYNLCSDPTHTDCYIPTVKLYATYISNTSNIKEITLSDFHLKVGSWYTNFMVPDNGPENGNYVATCKYFANSYFLGNQSPNVYDGKEITIYGCVGHPILKCYIRVDGITETKHSIFDDCAYDYAVTDYANAGISGVADANQAYMLEIDAGKKTLFGSMWENVSRNWSQTTALEGTDSTITFEDTGNTHWSDWNKDWAKWMYDADFGNMYHIQVSNVFDQHQQQLTNEQIISIIWPIYGEGLEFNRYKIVYYSLRMVGHIPYYKDADTGMWMDSNGRYVNKILKPAVKMDQFAEPLIPDSLNSAGFIYWMYGYCNIKIDSAPDYEGTQVVNGGAAGMNLGTLLSFGPSNISTSTTLSPGDLVFKTTSNDDDNEVGIFIGYVEGSGKTEGYVVTEKNWGLEENEGNVVLVKASFGTDFSYFVKPPCYEDYTYSIDINMDPAYGHDYIEDDDEILHENKLQYEP